jgi:hypothetical protein
MSVVKIRYNTNCTDNHMFWRVLIDGVEYICSNVIINVSSHSTRDDVYDPIKCEMVNKHHLTCTPNTITWKGDVVILD